MKTIHQGYVEVTSVEWKTTGTHSLFPFLSIFLLLTLIKDEVILGYLFFREKKTLQISAIVLSLPRKVNTADLLVGNVVVTFKPILMSHNERMREKLA